MTVTSLIVRNEYTATAGQTVFNYTFLIFTADDLNVYITPSGQDANDSTDLTTAYTVDVGTIGNPSGGFITLNSGVNSGDLVTIVSSIVEDRTTDYQNSGDFLPDTVNEDFDRVVSLTKQTSDRAGRTLAFEESVQNATALTLSAPAALEFLRWKSDESGVESVDLTVTGAPTDSSVITYNAGNNFTGGVVRSQENKNTELVSVKDFGAVGNGVADDTAAIQAAIDYVESVASVATDGGGTLLFPRGEYLITASLDVTKDHIRFTGEGKFSSGIFANSPSFDLINVDAQDATAIFGFMIDNMSVNAQGNATAGALIRCRDLIEGEIKSCVLRGWWNGIQLAGCNRVLIYAVVLSQTLRTSGTGNHGIRLIGDAAGGNCTGNHIIDVETNDQSVIPSPAYDVGLFVSSTDGLYMLNSHFLDAGTCMKIEPTGSVPNDLMASILATNCYLDGAEDNNLLIGGSASVYRSLHFSNTLIRAARVSAGVRFENTSPLAIVTFTGCPIRQQRNSGILDATVALTDNIIINGCPFDDNNLDNGSSQGDVIANGTNWTISNCHATKGGALGFGFRLSTNSAEGKISNCNVADSTAANPITDIGTNNRLRGITGYELITTGTETINNPATSVVATHNQPQTPSTADIDIRLLNDAAGVTRYFVDTITATQFTINVDTTPTVSAQFAWKVNQER